MFCDVCLFLGGKWMETIGIGLSAGVVHVKYVETHGKEGSILFCRFCLYVYFQRRTLCYIFRICCSIHACHLSTTVGHDCAYRTKLMQTK